MISHAGVMVIGVSNDVKPVPSHIYPRRPLNTLCIHEGLDGV